MKKRFGLRKAAALALLVVMPAQTALAGVQDVTLVIENQAYARKVTAIAEPEYILLPLRALADAYGYTIQYQQKDQSITLSKVGTYIECKIGSNRVRVNGIDKMIGYVPRVIDGVTYIPLQFVTECFGQMIHIEDNFANRNLWYVWLTEYRMIDGTDEIAFAENTNNYQGSSTANGERILYQLRENGETAKGIFIGSQSYHVTKAYGETPQTDGESLTYYFEYDPEVEKTPKKMVFSLADGVVTDVTIYLKN